MKTKAGTGSSPCLATPICARAGPAARQEPTGSCHSTDQALSSRRCMLGMLRARASAACRPLRSASAAGTCCGSWSPEGRVPGQSRAQSSPPVCGRFRHAQHMHARAAAGSVCACVQVRTLLGSCVGPCPQHAHRPKAVSFAMGCRVIRWGHDGGTEVSSLPEKRRRPRQRGGSKAVRHL